MRASSSSLSAATKAAAVGAIVSQERDGLLKRYLSVLGAVDGVGVRELRQRHGCGVGAGRDDLECFDLEVKGPGNVVASATTVRSSAGTSVSHCDGVSVSM